MNPDIVREGQDLVARLRIGLPDNVTRDLLFA